MDDVKHRPAEPRISVRAERAEVTRRRIVTAARHLFATDGYAATTLKSIAIEAGVAVQTVYAVFRSKPGIVRALRDLAVSQPEAGAAFEEAMVQTTPGRSLDLFARSIRSRWEIAGDIVSILGDAAAADPTLRAEVEAALRARREGITTYAKALTDRFGLAIDPTRAAHILLALTIPEVHAELIDVLGWSEGDYEAWLAAAMRRELLST
jgi:AcrR family transcriptional regulator